jgi:hydroxymethylpyrimidine pyrophosphatase-like HAD family hydrolase
VSIPPRASLNWLAIDLDGTLAEPLWTAENPTSEIGAPIQRNLIKLREAVRSGYKAVIHTSRPWTDYEAIEYWLNQNEIPFRAIQCGKLLAAAYIDDRAIHAEQWNWRP